MSSGGYWNPIYEGVDEFAIEDSFGEYEGEYEVVYGENCEEPKCLSCGDDIKWNGSNYICPVCGRVYSREEFFTLINADPPGPLCVTCDQLYPGCSFCNEGYDVEFRWLDMY